MPPWSQTDVAMAIVESENIAAKIVSATTIEIQTHSDRENPR
jgi:hypothetical protein